MGSVTRTPEYEPTLYDVIELMQEMHGDVRELKGDVSELKIEVHQLNRRVGSVELTLAEVQDTLEGVARAVDVDSVTLINHEERILQLENQA